MARDTATTLRSIRWRSRWPAFAAAAAMTGFLTGCGGGGDAGRTGSDPTAVDDASGSVGDAAAVQSVTLEAPQRLAPGTDIGLRWQVDGDAARVVVEVQRDAREAFEPVDATVDGSAARLPRGAAWRYDFPSAKVRVQACDAGGGCVRSNEQPLGDALLAGVTTLVAPDGVDGFGSPIALDASGDTLMVHATAAPAPSPSPVRPTQEVLFPYARGASGAWAALPLIERYETTFNFGTPFALSGDGRTLAVGDGVRERVYVYARDGTGPWQLQAELRAAVPRAGEQLGVAVSLSRDGQRLLAASGQRSLLFARQGTLWRQAHEFEPGPTVISGDGRTVAGLVRTGERPDYTYDWPTAVRLWRACPCDAGWRRVVDLASGEPLRQPDVDGSTFFGRELALSHDGSTVVTSDPNDLFHGPDRTRRSDTYSGVIYVFEARPSGWQRQALKTQSAPLYDYLGRTVSVSADGRVIAAAACGFSAGDAGVRRNHAAGTVVERPAFQCDNGGAAYVFERAADGNWSHVAAAIPDVRARFALYHAAFTVALSADGGTLAMGLTSGLAFVGPARLAVY